MLLGDGVWCGTTKQNDTFEVNLESIAIVNGRCPTCRGACPPMIATLRIGGKSIESTPIEDPAQFVKQLEVWAAKYNVK